MPHASPPSLFFRNAAELLTLAGSPGPRRGVTLGALGIVRHGGVLTEGETILRVGPTRSLEREALRLRADAIDCRGRVVMPGFVDSHTHLIFAVSRVNDDELRLRGKTYEQIAQAGGGIQSSAAGIRKTGISALTQRAGEFLDQFAAHGTTTVEVKSGYGLDVDQEIKILRAIRALQAETPLELIPTLMALHALPESFRGRSRQYVDQVIDRLIPAAARGSGTRDVEPGFSPASAAREGGPEMPSAALKGGATKPKNHAARQRLAEFIDCFCDRGAFSVEDCRRVLNAGAKFGLVPRLHAEQLARTGAARLGIEVHAASADHLDHLSAADIRALAQSDVVAALLPGANFHLRLKSYPPARRLIEAGAAVALATDFNPGTSPTLNMQFILSLACTQMRMTPAEAISAATVNGAAALRRADRVGSLEAGKQADLIVLAVQDYREIPYYFAVNHCVMTVKRGKVIYTSPKSRARRP
ncbi:MAG: amidohydrolase family protein [Terriglobia bacterium]